MRKTGMGFNFCCDFSFSFVFFFCGWFGCDIGLPMQNDGWEERRGFVMEQRTTFKIVVARISDRYHT